MVSSIQRLEQPRSVPLERSLVVCPWCHSSLRRRNGRLSCSSCIFQGSIRDRVHVLESLNKKSYFDDRWEAMRRGHSEHNGEWKLFYDRQLEYIQPFLKAGTLVLDVGCGPDILYQREKGCYLIGLDSCYRSILTNNALDLAIYGTAHRLPFPNQSVDSVICLYSIHHMTGETKQQNMSMVRGAFGEMARIIKPGGNLFIVEANPWPWVAVLQESMWNASRKLLGPALDQYFWDKASLIRLGRELLGNASLATLAVKTSAALMVSPIFTLPQLKLPRGLYPFEANLFHWQFPSG